MKFLKQLESFMKTNGLVALIGFLVLLMAIHQFSKRKSSSADPLTPPTFSETPKGAEETEFDPTFPNANETNDVSDLLPEGASHAYAPNLLKAGSVIGMVSQCSRNPNLQIRYEPPNPRGVSPPSESSIFTGHNNGLNDIVRH
jgi:hypothetical protein